MELETKIHAAADYILGKITQTAAQNHAHSGSEGNGAENVCRGGIDFILKFHN